MRNGLKVLLTGLLLWSCNLYAQDIPTVTADIDTAVELSNAPYLWDEAVPMDADTVDDYDEASSLLIRKVSEHKKAEFRKDKALQYHQKPPRKPTNLNWGWTSYLVKAIQALIRTFWWLIVIGLLLGMGFAIFVYLRRNGYVFRRNKEDFAEQVNDTDDEYYELSEYEKQLQAAISEGKLRLAVRIMYLQSLRILADRGIIAYSKEKTNAAYLRSMSQTQWHKPFARLTVDYEYIWYGEVPVNNEQFRVIQGQFSQFMNELGYTR